jgi:surface polysaccharide O-acyltransferase-like enzyme
VPVIGITVLAVYGLSKVHSLVTLTTAARYLLIGVFAPLLAIQLWVAFSGNRPSLRKVVAKAFAPQSLVVYVCGFLIFAVAPYVLITLKISTERVWLEFSFLMLRLSASALLILLGWVTTVGAISILSRSNEN